MATAGAEGRTSRQTGVVRWTVGEVEVVRVDASNFLLPTTDLLPGWAVPAFTPSVDQVPLAFGALAVRSGPHRIVVDPWIVDDGPRAGADPVGAVDRQLAALAEAAFGADEVDVVVGSHIDGTGWHTRPSPGPEAGETAGEMSWEPTFPRARYRFPAGELAAVAHGVEINGAEGLAPLHTAAVIDGVALPHRIDEAVTLVDAPGHNWGHAAVRIESGGDLALYPGHLVLSLLQVDDPDLDLGDSDLAVARTTRRRLLDELADRRGLLLTTLVGGPGGGRVERHGAGFRLVA
jgi:glyoxylase-like metal-dependent hydrolase (beta-lactamase superfamily II)